MAFVNSNNTIEEINAARIDNADYDVSNSVEKARNLIVASRAYLVLHADAVSTGPGTSFSENSAKVQDELEKAERWWARKVSSERGGRIVHKSFRNYR